MRTSRLNTTSALVLTGASLLVLLPFLGKAFNIDDPLYLWIAKQVLANPADFYGFPVNWEGYWAPMSSVMQNPPGAGYFIAGVALVAGLGETALRLAFLVPAVASVFGIYQLARRFTSLPLLASLASLTAPVFVLSATTVMSDLLMLSFWIWATELWLSGAEKDDPWRLLGGAALSGLAILIKYNAVALVPLLAAYSLLKRRPGHLVWMLVPLATLAGYEAWTASLYGKGLFMKAGLYSSSIRARTNTGLLEKGLTGLLFAGGCFAPILFFLPVARDLKIRISAVLFALAAAVAVWTGGGLGAMTLQGENGFDWGFMAQAAIFAAAGGALLVMAFSDALRGRDAGSTMLVLWVAGTFFFSAFVNWSATGRTMLPIAPAFGILLARAVESARKDGSKTLYLPLVPALALTFLISAADASFANSARAAARHLFSKYSDPSGQRSLWFQGHWGFQYYVESAGGSTLDWKNTTLHRGDLVVIPLNNYDLGILPMERLSLVEEYRSGLLDGAATMYQPAGAGFYSSMNGPLPYAFGSGFEDIYLVMAATGEIDLGASFPAMLERAKTGGR